MCCKAMAAVACFLICRAAVACSRSCATDSGCKDGSKGLLAGSGELSTVTFNWGLFVAVLLASLLFEVLLLLLLLLLVVLLKLMLSVLTLTGAVALSVQQATFSNALHLPFRMAVVW